jgi:GntR family transcriptional regulator/MocR family aminotransferase
MTCVTVTLAKNEAGVFHQTRLRYQKENSKLLRFALQGYIWRARALRCEPDQVVVMNGSQHAHH